MGGEYTSLDISMRTAVRNALRFLHEELGLDGPVAYAYLSGPHAHGTPSSTRRYA